jgi:ribosomal protein S18 acetylase RimI-like enzyme
MHTRGATSTKDGIVSMTTNVSDLAIRQARAEDTDAIFDICLRTADAGRDARALYSNPLLPGYLWAASYRVLEPDFAFVLADADRAVGYVIGAPDSANFDRRLEAEWWPYVTRQLAGFRPKTPHDEMAMGRIGQAEDAPEWLLADYPAHMHINLLPHVQASGWGRRMIDTELAALKARGVAGVHLGVSPTNEPAKGFYRYLGFEDISRDGKVTFGMRLRP